MSKTILQHLALQAEATPNTVALQVYGRPPLTYSGLRDHLDHVVAALGHLGVGRGDRVALLLPGGAELATACLSVMACATALPLNPDLKQPEYEAAIARLSPKLILTLPGGQHPIRAAAAAAGVPVIDVMPAIDGPAGVFALRGASSPAGQSHPAMAQADDVALVLQTSGTTSEPKNVPLTQNNLLSSARNLIDSLLLGADDCCLHFLPMFHIGGIVDVLLAPLLAGGKVICQPAFSSVEFYRDMAEFRPTWVQAVPVMLQEMLDTAAPHQETVAKHRLRFARSVSAPLPIQLRQAFEQAFSVPVIEIYGMTETAGVITSNPLPPAASVAGSVGRAVGPELRIIDSVGQPLPTNQIGEVVVRGANVMAGYEGGQVGNGAVFSDGWFRTGDLGYLDADGFLFLSGRLKDMINRGGEKVGPHEVDQVLLDHPAVEDAATFAVPHPTLGEDIAALLVLKARDAISKAELTDYLRSRLAYFKVPRALLFVDRIPRGANGKLQRAKLSEQFAALAVGEMTTRPEFVAPQNPVAKMLAEIWSRILNQKDIGLRDDFFNLGGDSLKAASFINELQQKWGDTIYVSSVFDAPTLAGYEQFLRVHYPEVVARMLGEYVAPAQKTIDRVTPAMVTQLRAAIAHPAAPAVLSTQKNPSAIFVLSPPRSGSTLLRVMLGGHPQLFAPPELYLLSYNNLADRKNWYSGSQRFQLEGNVRALMQIRNEPLEAVQRLVSDLEERACPTQEYYRLMQDWLGDRILVDKTPAYAVEIETLQRAEQYFDNPIYIHLLRHPYGMIRSFEEAKLEQLWYPRLVGTEAGRLESNPYNRRQLAELIWLILHQNIQTFLKTIPQDRQFQIRFEDMVSTPGLAMERLCRKLGIAFEPAMLTPQDDRRQRMTDGIHEISRMIGDPKFHQHKKIESDVADQWKSAYDIDFLSDQTWALASALGYDETIAGSRGRKEIEL